MDKNICPKSKSTHGVW